MINSTTIIFEGEYLLQLFNKGRQNEYAAFLDEATKLISLDKLKSPDTVDVVDSLSRFVRSFEHRMNKKYSVLSYKKCLRLIPVFFIEKFLCEDDLSELTHPQKLDIFTMIHEYQEKISPYTPVAEKHLNPRNVTYRFKITRSGKENPTDK